MKCMGIIINLMQKREQKSISKTKDIKVKGLTYIQNFITKQQEDQLIKNILKEEWNTSLKRRTQHYGYQYMYNAKNELKQTKDIPVWILSIKQQLEMLINKLRQLQSEQYFSYKHYKTKKGDKILFDQIIINEYDPGQGISPHIDNPFLFNDIVVSLSLSSPTTMIFQNDEQKKQVNLARRSIVILDHTARYQWKHSIPSRKKDNGIQRATRYSLTFRTMNQKHNQKNSKINNQNDDLKLSQQ